MAGINSNACQDGKKERRRQCRRCRCRRCCSRRCRCPRRRRPMRLKCAQPRPAHVVAVHTRITACLSVSFTLQFASSSLPETPTSVRKHSVLRNLTKEIGSIVNCTIITSFSMSEYRERKKKESKEIISTTIYIVIKRYNRQEIYNRKVLNSKQFTYALCYALKKVAFFVLFPSSSAHVFSCHSWPQTDIAANITQLYIKSSALFRMVQQTCKLNEEGD